MARAVSAGEREGPPLARGAVSAGERERPPLARGAVSASDQKFRASGTSNAPARAREREGLPLASEVEALRLDLGDRDVGALVLRAEGHRASLVLGHGAGAGMEHANMAGIAEAFAKVGVSTFRFNFPYREDGRNRVDSKDVSTATITAALGAAQERLDGPHLLGGHSFGGRMASHAVVDRGLDVAGLVFCSFPLHNPRKPSLARAEHMDAIGCPMLFLSGSRDGMASTDLMTELATRLRATLHRGRRPDPGCIRLRSSGSMRGPEQGREKTLHSSQGQVAPKPEAMRRRTAQHTQAHVPVRGLQRWPGRRE